MNAPDAYRQILRQHVASIEQRHPIKIIGVLPRGSVAHIFDDDAIDLLAEKRPGLGLFELSRAESDLGDLLRRPVGIVLTSGLRGREADEFPKIVSLI